MARLSVDSVLFALRILGFRYWWEGIHLWRSYCPVCCFRHLEIVEGTPRVRLSCRSACHEADILAAFSELLQPCTLDDALCIAEGAVRTANEALGER